MLAFIKKILEVLTDIQHRHFVDYLAQINSGISAVALFPQLYTTVIEKSSQGLSGTTFFLIACNSIIWMLYGLHRQIPPLIISSSLNFMASSVILGYILT